MLLADIQPHARQFLPQLLGRALGRVGQKQKALFVFLEPRYKFLHARQQRVAAVDHAVHIADEALLCAQSAQIQLFRHLILP